MSSAICLKKLNKTFFFKETTPGILGTLKGLFFAEKKPFAAIQNLSLKVNKGERVAFIGPNGAGKSTTIKILTGILQPTSGEVKVLGLIPSKDRILLGHKIGTVFGQRSQLWYHLPPLDSFNLLSKIYEIPPDTYKKQLIELVELFEIAPLLQRPVKTFSLGERMRCEIVASLLHKPEILFLDEPTIGLDNNAKLTIRNLLNTLSKVHGTTLFLTSHDTADIEHVCNRVLVLDKGSLLLDSSLKELRQTYKNKKTLSLLTEEKTVLVDMPGVKVVENKDHRFSCKVDLQITQIEPILQRVLKQTTVNDMTLEDLSMDEIVRLLYGNKSHV